VISDRAVDRRFGDERDVDCAAIDRIAETAMKPMRFLWGR
jgi:hypothetical protein